MKLNFQFHTNEKLWNNDPSYDYASPETLAFINLFGAIKGMFITTF